MEHPRLVAWFDDLEDAVTTAFALTDAQRAGLKARKAPRAGTWVMLSTDTEARDVLRKRLSEAHERSTLPLAHDCNVLEARATFTVDDDAFDKENGFTTIDIDYIEEGSAEDLRRELLSDADDYAASGETGWFYAVNDGEFDIEGGDPL